MRDWSAVPYPAWWLARAAERRRELDDAVGAIRRAVRTSPELVGVLVFGSYATGHVGPESDLDLMVVTTLPLDPVDSGARYLHVRRLLALSVPSDVVVYAPDEFERLRRERAFVAQAWREGIWIDATSSG